MAESARFFEFVSAELPKVTARWREVRADLDRHAPAASQS
jgi:hypothetical protein